MSVWNNTMARRMAAERWRAAEAKLHEVCSATFAACGDTAAVLGPVKRDDIVTRYHQLRPGVTAIHIAYGDGRQQVKLLPDDLSRIIAESGVVDGFAAAIEGVGL